VTKDDDGRVAAIQRSFSAQKRLFEGPTSVFAPKPGAQVEWAGPLAASYIALEVACGAAHVAEQLAPLVRQVIGVDLTPALLAIGAERLREHGIANVALEEGDAEALPFVDESFDVVVCRSSMHHFAHPDRAMAEMRRVTRPGGRVIITDLVVPDGADREAYDAAHRVLDPSHIRCLTDRELRDLGGPRWTVTREDTSTGRVPLEVILTDVSDAARIRGLLRTEIDGGPATGLAAQLEHDELTVAFTTRTCHYEPED
jgi:SAM-dependent methyltransferase